jgi:cathepsin B
MVSVKSALVLVIMMVVGMGMGKSVYEMTDAEFANQLADSADALYNVQDNTAGAGKVSVKANPSLSVPQAYDVRMVWPKCMTPIQAQEKCIAGAAFAAAGLLGERLCINTSQSIVQSLSSQYLIDCVNQMIACKQELSAEQLFDHLQIIGTPTEECQPYQSQQGIPYVCRTNWCMKKGVKMVLYRCVQGSYKVIEGADSIKEEILRYGPVMTYFDVYADFKNYIAGIYTRASNVRLGAAATRVIGWGVENGIEYWICRSSFGLDWGENGHFRIKLGEVNIGKKAYACTPLIT